MEAIIECSLTFLFFSTDEKTEYYAPFDLYSPGYLDKKREKYTNKIYYMHVMVFCSHGLG